MNTNTVCAYDELNFDGLERRGNYRFIAFREDILHALDKREAAAIIFQIVYRWQTEYKRNEVLKLIEERKKSGLKPFTSEEIENLMFVYMSYNDFVRESGGSIGYNTVIRTIKYLIEEKKVLIQRENHDPRFGDYEYSINKDVARQLLKSLPIDPAFSPKMPKKKASSTQMGTPKSDDSTHLGIPAQRYTQMGTDSTHLGTEVYPNGCTSQERHKSPQGEGTNADNSSTPSLSSLSDDLLVAELQRRELERLSTAQQEISTSVEKTTSKQRDTEPLLSAEGRQVRAYWHELGYEATSASNEYWNTLSKHIQTFEQFKSLYEYTRSKLVGAKDETVYPGNLVKCVNGWKQKQTPAPVEAKATVYKPRDLAAEMRAMEAKYSKPAGRN